MLSTTEKKTWIDVSSSGHVAIRLPHGPIHDGFLPCFAVESMSDAPDLIVFACSLSRDNTGYVIPNFREGNLSSIDEAKDRLKKLYGIMLKRRASR